MQFIFNALKKTIVNERMLPIILPLGSLFQQHFLLRGLIYKNDK